MYPCQLIYECPRNKDESYKTKKMYYVYYSAKNSNSTLLHRLLSRAFVLVIYISGKL